MRYPETFLYKSQLENFVVEFTCMFFEVRKRRAKIASREIGLTGYTHEIRHGYDNATISAQIAQIGLVSI